MDPFCGSGTLVVEAALIARDIAPGLIRKNPYAFEIVPVAFYTKDGEIK